MQNTLYFFKQITYFDHCNWKMYQTLQAHSLRLNNKVFDVNVSRDEMLTCLLR